MHILPYPDIHVCTLLHIITNLETYVYPQGSSDQNWFHRISQLTQFRQQRHILDVAGKATVRYILRYPKYYFTNRCLGQAPATQPIPEINSENLRKTFQKFESCVSTSTNVYATH